MRPARSPFERDHCAARIAAYRAAGDPDDIAPVAVFLASGASRWITGDIVHVDGGSKL